MKKYSAPNIRISHFSLENVLTTSTPTQRTAMEKAESAAVKIEQANSLYIFNY